MFNRKGHCNIRPKLIYQQKTPIKKAKPVYQKTKKTCEPVNTCYLVNNMFKVWYISMMPINHNMFRYTLWYINIRCKKKTYVRKHQNCQLIIPNMCWYISLGTMVFCDNDSPNVVCHDKSSVVITGLIVVAGVKKIKSYINECD